MSLALIFILFMVLIYFSSMITVKKKLVALKHSFPEVDCKTIDEMFQNTKDFKGIPLIQQGAGIEEFQVNRPKQGVVGCFCSKQFSKFQSWSKRNTKFKFYDEDYNPKNEPICKRYIETNHFYYVQTKLSSVVIVVMNIFFRKIMFYIISRIGC